MKILVSTDLEIEVSEKAAEFLTHKTIESIAKEEMKKKLAKARLGILKDEDTKPVKIVRLAVKVKDSKKAPKE